MYLIYLLVSQIPTNAEKDTKLFLLSLLITDSKNLTKMRNINNQDDISI